MADDGAVLYANPWPDCEWTPYRRNTVRSARIASEVAAAWLGVPVDQLPVKAKVAIRD